MTRPRSAAAAVLLLLAGLPGAHPAAAAAPARTAAVVIEVSGQATATSQHGPLRRLARLVAGDVVRTEPGASLKLAFASGLRYRLGGESSLTVGEGDATHRSGQVEPLPRVPRFPVVPEIVDDRGLGIGGEPIRGHEITGLSPRCTAVPAGEVRLTWEPLPHAGAYRVEVYDVHAEPVYAAEGLSEPAAVVPAAKLPPGRYSFKVQTTDQPGSQAAGQAHFAVLPAATSDAWRELRAALEKEGDAGAWALLAEVDRQLVLRREERDDLRAALKLAPEDPGLAAELARVERLLAPSPAP